MVQNEEQEPTYLNQILDQVFGTLYDNENFDKATIVRLRELGKSNGLADYKNVVEALCADGET